MTKLVYHHRQIDEGLATSGQPTGEQLRAAAEDGYEVVINLLSYDVAILSREDEAKLVKSMGMTYVHIPVDFGNPREEELLEFFEAMEQHEGRKLLVHCAANMRVTAFLGLYLAIKKNQPLTNAFDPMRSVWSVNPVWYSFIMNMLDKHRPDSRAPQYTHSPQ